MAIAEGRTLPFTGPEAIDVAALETFAYAGPEQEIVTETRELSPVCPYSGLPDFATLRITAREMRGGAIVYLSPKIHFKSSSAN
jgi:NADPH-dependent 7-cyano-7-deazaguanine reductase QueF